MGFTSSLRTGGLLVLHDTTRREIGSRDGRLRVGLASLMAWVPQRAFCACEKWGRGAVRTGLDNGYISADCRPRDWCRTGRFEDDEGGSTVISGSLDGIEETRSGWVEMDLRPHIPEFH